MTATGVEVDVESEEVEVLSDAIVDDSNDCVLKFGNTRNYQGCIKIYESVPYPVI